MQELQTVLSKVISDILNASRNLYHVQKCIKDSTGLITLLSSLIVQTNTFQGKNAPQYVPLGMSCNVLLAVANSECSSVGF
jgi:hypothetical protein